MTVIRTRFAPSPTGSLHLGGARTALYNYLLAKALGGSFVLRIEDTDAERSTQDAQHALLHDLQWLGLLWDEGPSTPSYTPPTGSHGPYTQSNRYEIYRRHARILLEQGKAYYCFATSKDIETERAKAKHPAAFQFQSPYRQLSLSEAEKKITNGESAVVRFKNDYHDQVFPYDDLVRGPITLPGHMIGDFVILRNDQSPVYNFCCAVDDALMRITHVLRGEEHLSNTLRQLMIYKALGFTPPAFGHLSLILGSDQKKLSKRTGAQSVGDFEAQGYMPSGLINYLALLGWSDPKHREILTLDELIQAFNTDRLNPAAPMYDLQKCQWVNAQHMKTLSDEALWHAIAPLLQAQGLTLPQDTAWQKKSVATFRADWQLLNDSVENYSLFAEQIPPMDEDAIRYWQEPHTINVIQAWQSALHALDGNIDQPLDTDTYQSIIQAIKTDIGVKGKALFMPIRIAMIGKAQGTDLASCISLLSIKRLIQRAAHYVETMA